MKQYVALLLAVCLLSPVCAFAFDLSPYEIEVLPQHFLSVPAFDEQIEEDGMCLVIYDSQGRRVHQMRIEGGLAPDLADCVALSDGGYLIALVDMPRQGEAAIYLRRVGADGGMLWQATLPETFCYNWSVLCEDGAGGAFYAFADYENYKLAQIWHVDAEGAIDWSRKLEAEGLVFSHFTGRFDAQRNRLIIAGSAVSASKGVYDAIIVEIDRDANLTVAQRKDFSCRPDYGFSVMMDESGAFYAHSRADYLDTKGTAQMLVPLDALPDAPVGSVMLHAYTPAVRYYVNRDGGRKYHILSRCGSIDEKYYDSIEEITQEETEAFAPCSYCGADAFSDRK